MNQRTLKRQHDEREYRKIHFMLFFLSTFSAFAIVMLLICFIAAIFNWFS